MYYNPKPFDRATVCSWNCNKASHKDEEAEYEISKAVGKDAVVCIQEAQFLRADIDPSDGGASVSVYQKVFSSEGLAAILIPPSLQPGLRWRSDLDVEFSSACHCSGAILGTLGVLSAYFVHADRDISVFKQTLQDCSKVLKYLRSLQVATTVLCCDFDFSVDRGYCRQDWQCRLGWTSE